MKGFLAFAVVLGLILLGIGVWTATPQGGGGLGEEGGAGQDLQDQEQGQSPGVVPQERPGDAARSQTEGIVFIEDGALEPARLVAAPNSVVTILNEDDVAHGIDFEDDQLQDAEEIAPGDAHTVEVGASGRFTYELTGDAEASGTIVVQEEE